jgi:hypothetical protein
MYGAFINDKYISDDMTVLSCNNFCRDEDGPMYMYDNICIGFNTLNILRRNVFCQENA